MRLPFPFIGSWNWTARGLVYIISWLRPSNILPTPIAQIVFPLEQAGQLFSLAEGGLKVAEGGLKVAEGILNRPFPTAQGRKLLAFNSKLRERVKRGDITVTIDELIQSGAVQFEPLTDNLSVTQLPNGNYQFTLNWMASYPDSYLLQTPTRSVYMPVAGEGDIQVSETFEVTAHDWQAFVIDLATNAQRKVKVRLIDRKCIGTTHEKFSKWFPDHPDPDPGAGGRGGGGGIGNIISNKVLIREEKKEDFFKNRHFKQSDYSQTIAVQPYSPVFGKPPSPRETFVAYFFIALPFIYVIARVIKKFLEKYNEKK